MCGSQLAACNHFLCCEAATALCSCLPCLLQQPLKLNNCLPGSCLDFRRWICTMLLLILTKLTDALTESAAQVLQQVMSARDWVRLACHSTPSVVNVLHVFTSVTADISPHSLAHAVASLSISQLTAWHCASILSSCSLMCLKLGRCSGSSWKHASPKICSRHHNDAVQLDIHVATTM